MKRIVLLVMIIILTSCSSKGSGNNEEKAMDPILMGKMAAPKLQHKDELFEMSVHLDKTTFEEGEPIVYSASITYIGDESSITVWGPQAKIVFYITDGKQFEMEGASTTELAPTTYIKGEKHQIPFQKSGGYASDDLKASYWKSFYGERDLLLPKGTYLIAANSNFSLDESVVDSHYNGSVYATITVE
ncbi:hypothetical protein [Paenibacillus paridis]|uniref:hypothetical protein n=1 Tax=Paenibacillus paridis TaxID=2583376 RepID=UPI00112010BF|nr:hypothetical protein [Paenibacillus paridis]